MLDLSESVKQDQERNSIQNRLPCPNADSTPTRPPIRSPPLQTIAKTFAMQGF